MDTHIQKLISEYRELNTFLTEQRQISQSIEINNHYRKILLLSCASFYESQITKVIKEYVGSRTEDDKIISFVNKKAINRNYHTFFDWNNNRNINQFLSLFGPIFKHEISNEINNSEELSSQVRAFIDIGAERNRMVHENFLEYRLEKTFDEIVELHEKAFSLINYIKRQFQNDL